ncbi:ATP-dependent DNA helicase RecG [Varunaivibrio sulfuroxidans]|uniref:ATP-dependent DNA helicase RecG n=1 Tax=Varunaivibrio sulfuroxidans TaxID=1773489 RepID=A0A4R3JGP2_9PROT|nr:ATP-dependent DNA helicase RecG [Varunaivibrio sulfuroxidans]TCS64386.1 ATP-dependent DNA helicase RecG [Varunaivibrio sulfuroxidans]WES31183.1 ATP-dependent DNA helicase RecG [Varunaivibrio sulfuroxidans]
MRPEILYPLFKPVGSLKGVGPRMEKALARIGIDHVADVLWRLPGAVIDRRNSPSVKNAVPGDVATFTVTVDRHVPPTAPRQPYRVHCHDETGTMVLVFFHAREDYLTKTLPMGKRRVVSGTVEHYDGQVQMTHPDHIVSEAQKESILKFEPLYALTAGVSQKMMRKAVMGAFENTPDLAEWIDDAYLKKQNWCSWRTALERAHHPQTSQDVTLDAAHRSRLAYDEILANQLALALVRAAMKKTKGRPNTGNGVLRAKVMVALPFSLTGAQEKALSDITRDMESTQRMLRLLQGDVGSGKTVVALLAMLVGIEAGGQAALMAPTDVLARQHMKTIAPLAEAAGVECALLTGREKGKNRDALLARLKNGEISLIVGTHALFQGDVDFHDLRIAVIDEQHRFGVHQRLGLTEKGDAVDVLVMTATPIPRTLMLTAYGDMDVSQLRDKPAGRKPIDTRVMPAARIADVVEGLKRQIAQGHQAYWVCPLVEESETLDLSAAQDRFDHLQSVFGARVGLVHGRMKGADKDAVMQAFAEGRIDILVATTVIEVGVDVARANVMIIEHAERFGLAQLHQLRGRVGRGAAQASCLLLYGTPLGDTARTRLKVLRQSDDGFHIAEEDLKLRGAGELMGTRQSGLPEFFIADLTAHADLLDVARKDAQLVLDKDPQLQGPRGQALRVLLYLFERDSAVHYLRSG